MKKIIAIVIAVLLSVLILAGCGNQASQVSYNVSQEADNFNVTRRLVVMNGRTDTIVFELIGRFSFELESSRIIAIVEAEDGVYKKISVGLPQEAFWFVDDLSGADVSTFRYEVNFLPEKIIPVEIVSKD